MSISCAELKQRPPEVDRIARRVVELVRQLSGEAQAQDPAAHACHFADAVSREPGQLLHPGLLQQLRGPRTGHVDGAQRLGLVQQVDVEAPGLRPVADPHLAERGSGARQRKVEPVIALSADQAVVQDVAALVQQQHISAATGAKRRDFRRIQQLQERERVRPGYEKLPQRTHIHDRDRLAHGPILGERIAVGPGTPPPSCPVHPRTETEVLVVERRARRCVVTGTGRDLADRELSRERARRERRLQLVRLSRPESCAGEADRPSPDTSPSQRVSLA